MMTFIQAGGLTRALSSYFYLNVIALDTYPFLLEFAKAAESCIYTSPESKFYILS